MSYALFRQAGGRRPTRSNHASGCSTKPPPVSGAARRGEAASRRRGRAPGAAGPARNSTTVAALVDTNVLVYRFDPRFPVKQTVARELLRKGVAQGSLRLPHQAVVGWPLAGGEPLLPPTDARREAERSEER